MMKKEAIPLRNVNLHGSWMRRPCRRSSERLATLLSQIVHPDGAGPDILAGSVLPALSSFAFSNWIPIPESHGQSKFHYCLLIYLPWSIRLITLNQWLSFSGAFTAQRRFGALDWPRG